MIRNVGQDFSVFIWPLAINLRQGTCTIGFFLLVFSFYLVEEVKICNKFFVSLGFRFAPLNSSERMSTSGVCYICKLPS